MLKTTCGKTVLVDSDVLMWAKNTKWSIDINGYVRCWIHTDKTKTFHLHKLITGTSKQTIDHIDRDKLNNKRANLRIVTKSQNAINGIKARRKYSSKYRGVGKHKNKWRAYAEYQKKQYHLGSYSTEYDAAVARDKFWYATGEIFVPNIGKLL